MTNSLLSVDVKKEGSDTINEKALKTELRLPQRGRHFAVDKKRE